MFEFVKQSPLETIMVSKWLKGTCSVFFLECHEIPLATFPTSASGKIIKHLCLPKPGILLIDNWH